ALAPVLAGLVAAPPGARSRLLDLGVEPVGLADVVDRLPLTGEPTWWHALYVGLAPLADDSAGREALGALPVPLADGRLVRGVRGLLLLDDVLAPEVLQPLRQWGLRLVHPEAAHPLLTRLGATPATARGLLDDPAVRAAVDDSPDADDPAEVAAAVLGLVAAAGDALAPGDLPWLADLALPDADDDPAPAGALALPGSLAARVLDPDDIGLLHERVVDAWPREALVAVGVLDLLAVVRAADVDPADPPDELADVAGLEEWFDLADGHELGEVVAVRDLDVVLDAAWPEVVRALAADPVSRRALVDPVRRRDGGALPPPTAWWLGRRLGSAGTVEGVAAELDGLLDPAPAWVRDLDPAVRSALGVAGAGEPPSAVLPVLLDRLGDDRRDPPVTACLKAWALLADAGDDLDVDPPARVRVLRGDGTALVHPRDAVVADDPRWLQRTDLGGLVVAPARGAERLADLLDVRLASEVASGVLTSDGSRTPVPQGVRAVLPGAPTEWTEHDELQVDGHDVEWWVDDTGHPHAATLAGLARALAWAAGSWAARWTIAEVLADPASAVQVAVEDAAG
ncbi:thioesterase domain-containing protein, partial [Angustibacter aerolatus]